MKLQIGTLVECKTYISFADGSRHYPGDKFIVDYDNQAYYENFTPVDYEVIQ